MDAGMRRGSLAAALLLCASCAWPAAFGQALRDPTEPPSGAAARGGAQSAPEAVLQSVIVSGGRRLALIGGRTYQTGERVGDATVVSISSSEVILRDASGTRVLRLHPHLERADAGSKAAGRVPATEGRP